jgi:hypothetical protein
MRYLCLVYGDEAELGAMDFGECVDFDAELRAAGHCLASESLQPTPTATTVRVRDGRAVFTDGPFAETKEQLTGFYLVEAADLDAALAMAARIPPARVGSVEVRPIRPLREMVKNERTERGGAR